MGSSVSNPVTDADNLDSLDENGSRSPIASKDEDSYNGAQPSGTESAQREETEPTMRAECTDYSDECFVSNTGCRTVNNTDDLFDCTGIYTG